MNDIDSQNENRSPSVPEHQVRKLNELIEDVRECCESEQILESGKFGLPYAEIRCLLLFDSERYLTVKGISKRLEVAKSRVTKLVNNMNQKGLIKCIPDPADGRVKLLRLTPLGRSIVERINVFQKRMQTVILEKLDPADRSRVISGLELLRSAMHETKADMETDRSRMIASAKHQTDEVDHA